MEASATAVPRCRATVRARPLAGLASLGFAMVLVAGSAWLHLRAREAPPPPPEPVSVAVAAVQPEAAYHVEARFAGRLEAARSTALAFERPGTVVTVLVDEGGQVTAGEVVARLDTARLEAERAELRARRAETAARLEIARLDLTRVTRLREAGHAAAEAFDEARLEVQRLEAAVAGLEAGLQALAVDLEKSVLRAPYAGTVAARLRDEGAVLAAGTPVLELLEAGRREARIGVPASVAATLRAGERYTLRAGGDTLPGTLAALRPDLSGRTRTVEALFRLSGSSGGPLRELVELTVEREVPEAGFWVPLAALTEAERGLWAVHTLAGAGEHGRVAREAVEVLHVSGERAYVRGSLAEHARVVIAGPHRVVPGQPVTVAAGGE